KKKTRTLVDEEKTAAVKQKATEIQEEFEKWLWSDADRKKDLLRTFNKKISATEKLFVAFFICTKKLTQRSICVKV
ncbi:MAG: hypothetical protein IJS81_09255, partial [Selenomonadaceae bacterium]|nr:hypothetical protein [Selenomonadaceae bacterium]